MLVDTGAPLTFVAPTAGVARGPQRLRTLGLADATLYDVPAVGDDPFGLAARAAKAPGRHPSGRALRSTELKALQTLGLDDTATPDQVKSQYKTLVKRLHPDANNGSRANEDTLKAVIQAYDHLRSSGFC
jgi:hypothetical protein